MARRMAGDDSVLYRAVFTVTYDDPEESGGRREFTDALGPYIRVGAAKAALKAADADFQWYRRYHTNVVVSGRIEKATTTWEPVE